MSAEEPKGPITATNSYSRETAQQELPNLLGKNLAYRCALGEPSHADDPLDLGNSINK